MAIINLTNGEEYRFGKVGVTPVALSGTDNAQAVKIFRKGVDDNNPTVSIVDQFGATNGCLKLTSSHNHDSDNILTLHADHSTATNDMQDCTIKMTSGARFWRFGVDGTGGSKPFFKLDFFSSNFIDTTFNAVLEVHPDGDLYVQRDVYIQDDLHVYDDAIISGSLILSGSAQDAMVIGQNNGHDSRIVIFEARDSVRNRLHLGADATCAYIEGTFGSGGSTDVQIRNNGSVCADFEASEVYVHTIDSSAGNADMRYSTSTGEMTYSTSTRNIKKNIVEISGSDDILNVKSVSYDYKDGSGAEIGFIAEDVAAVNSIFARYGPDFKYDDSGKRVHKIDKWEDNGSGKIIPKGGAFPKGTGPKDRYETNSDNQVPIDINVRALLSHAVQKIQDLEARVKALENA